MVPRIRICLPVHASRSLVCDPHAVGRLIVCAQTTEPARSRPHKPQLLNPHVLEPASPNYRACMLQLLKPVHLDPTLSNKRSCCNEKPCAPQVESSSTPPNPLAPHPGSLPLDKALAQQRRPSTTKKKGVHASYLFPPLKHLTFCRDLASVNKALHFEIHLSLMVSFFLFF